MGDPDELYTLRAQYALGHYSSALLEAKQIARRPMSVELQSERDEYTVRAHTALRHYDKIDPGDRPALQALALKAKYESAAGNTAVQKSVLGQLKSMVADDPVVNLAAAQCCVAAGDLQTAYPMIADCKKLPEAWACKIQILLAWNRLDSAKAELEKFQNVHEESVVADLTSVYVQLTQGASGGAAAEHSLQALSEQYGPSVYLLNLSAAAHAVQGDWAAAETKLQQAISDFTEKEAVTAINSITVAAHLKKPYSLATVDRTTDAGLEYLASFESVDGAFDREAAKYKVAA